jgi:sortase A
VRIPIDNKARDSHLLPEGSEGAGAFAVKPRWRSARLLLERALWALALLAIGFLGYVELDRMLSEARQTRRLNELAPATSIAAPASGLTSSAPAAMRPAPANGEPIGRLEIPGVGISAIVAAGTDDLTLRRGVGHIDGTALPGEPGNVGLAGHRDTIFRGLRKLRPADRIFLVTAGGTFEYSVESLRTVAPERNDVLDSSSQPMLTLVTCFPFDFVGPAPLRYIVRAREIGRPGVPAPLEDAVARP